MSSEGTSQRKRISPKEDLKEQEEEILKQMQQAQAQAVTEEQKKFLDALNNLIFNVQELAYTAALVPETVINQHEELKDLMNSVRDVIRSAYNFHKLVKAGVAKQ